MSSQPSLISVAEDTHVQRPSSYSQWQFFRDTAAAGAGTYWAMNKDGIKELIGGGAGGGAQLFVNAFVVDAAFGNDTGAVFSSLMDDTNNPTTHKFATIIAALAATTGRQLIIVYPGVYVENSNLFKNNVVYYFYPGATVFGFFSNTETGEITDVFGSAIFQSSAANFIDMPTGRLYIEGDEISNGLLNGRVVNIGSAAANDEAPVVIVNTKQNLFSDSNCVRMRATGPDARLYVTVGGRMFHTTAAPSNEMIQVGGPGGETHFQGEAYIKSVGGYWTSPNYAAGGGSLFELGNANENGAMALIQIDGDIYDVHTDPASTRSVVTCQFCEFTRIIINGNFYGQNQQALIVSDSPSGNTIFTWNGNIYTDRIILSMTDAFGTAAHQEVRLNGEAITIEPTTAISINGAGTQVPKLILNGSLYNNSVGGIGVTKTLAAAELLFTNYKIVTGGGAAVSTGAADTYLVIHSLARNNANVNGTNAITGSIDYVDALVQ